MLQEPGGKTLAFCTDSLVLSTNKAQHWASWQGEVFKEIKSTFTKQAKRVNSELNGKINQQTKTMIIINYASGFYFNHLSLLISSSVKGYPDVSKR